MGKKLLLVSITLLVFGCMAWAAETSLVGVVSDDHCGLKHSTPSDEAAACVKKCVAAGGKYVLVYKGKVYKLDAQEKFAPFAGRKVKVTGTVSGDSITVSAVAAAPAPAPKKAEKKAGT